MIDVCEELLGDVLLSAPGCPDMTAERAIDRATRQFFADTHAWRYRCEPQPLIKGINAVDLSLPVDTQILRPFWVMLGDRRLTGVSMTEATSEEGQPTGFAFQPDGVLILDRIPRETTRWDKGITAEVSLTAKRGKAQLPGELDPFLSAIESLASSILLSMPTVEWRDRQGAADAMMFYEREVIKARHFGAQRGQHVHRTVRYGGI